MKIKKLFLGLLLTVYIVVAVFLTACLLTYNDYMISEFGDRSLIIVKNDEFEPNYKKGTLLIVQKNKNEDIKTGDEIFFYNTYKNQVSVSYSKVLKSEKITDEQTTYTITGNYELSSDYVIGKAGTTKSINNVGTVLSFLESRWGFLLIIVFPISVLFIYEIYIVIKELVKPDADEKEAKKHSEASIKDEPKEHKTDDSDNQNKDEDKQEESKPETKEEKEQSNDEEIKEEKEEPKQEEVKESEEENKQEEKDDE